MKFSCLLKDLNQGLSVVRRGVPSRSTLPATQNVLIEAKEQRLKLVTTNLTTSFTTWVNTGGDFEEGAITLPARMLYEFLGSVSNDHMTLELGEGSNRAAITAGRSTATIIGIDATEFPPVPVIGDGESASVNGKVLRQSIALVAMAAAVEEFRPVLTGVELRLKDQGFTMAAADGFRLAVNRGQLLAGAPHEAAPVVPAASLKELQRLLPQDESTVGITLDEAGNRVMFRITSEGAPPVEIMSQILQGTFPDFEQLIPDEWKTRLTLDSKQTLQSAKTATIFAKESADTVKLEFGTDTEKAVPVMVMNTGNEDFGNSTERVELGKMEGQDNRIAFNSRYLIDVLNAMDGELMVMEIMGPSNPSLFKKEGSDDYRHVIMPVFVPA